MSQLTPHQKAQLSALWAGLPTGIRQQLLVAAGSSGKLSVVLGELNAQHPIEIAQPTGLPAYLFEIFHSVTGEQHEPPSRAHFSPDDISVIREHCGLEGIAPPTDRGDAKAATRWRQEAAQHLRALISDAEKTKGGNKKLHIKLGPDYLSKLSEAANLLAFDHVLSVGLKGLPDVIDELSPDMVSKVSAAYEDISEATPEAGLWYLKLVLARLEKSAQIFRIVEKVGKRSDDALVSKTDLADIGDLVLENASYFADRLSRPPTSIEDADSAGRALESFVKVSVGMTREFGIRKDGHWGKTLYSIRAKASSFLEDAFKKSVKTVHRGLPHPVKGNRGLDKAGPIPDGELIERAEAELRFLALSADWASQAAVASAQKAAAEKIEMDIDECVRDILEVIRASDGEEQERAVQGIAVVVRYMRAGLDDENADLIERRATAVRANAA